MSQDEIIAMAQEAGMQQRIATPTEWWCWGASLERFAALVAAKEREKIATWIEPQRNDIPACGFEFAASIRARGDK